MRDIKYYKSRPKIDAHNHLNLGMRYPDFFSWSGTPIPDFPRVMDGLDEMHDVIAKYTRPRCRTAQDVADLIGMSIDAAVADGVTVIEGSIDIGFMVHFEGNVDAFLRMTEDLVKKHSEKTLIRPELGLGKTFDKDKISMWAPELMKSGVFASIDLYGPEIEDGIEEFKYIFDLADKLSLKKRAHVGEFSDARSVRRFVEYFGLDEVQHGIGAAQDDAVLQFLADRKVRCNVCPQSNVMLKSVKSLKEHPIKRMIDAGVPVTVGTDDLLFFDRSVSEQIFDLVSAGVITESDADRILDQAR